MAGEISPDPLSKPPGTAQGEAVPNLNQSALSAEAGLAEKQREQSRQMLRQVRSQVLGSTGGLHSPTPSPRSAVPSSSNVPPKVAPPANFVPDAFEFDFEELFAQNVLIQLKDEPPVPVAKVPPAPKAMPSPGVNKPNYPVGSVDNPIPVSPSRPVIAQPVTKVAETSTARFRPQTLSKATQRANHPERDIPVWERRLSLAGNILEAIVLIALLIIIINWLLLMWNPFNIMQSNLSPGSTSGNIATLWSNGSVINVDAGNTFLNLPTPEATATALPPSPTPVATATAVPVVPTVAGGQSVAPVIPFTPLVAPTATPLPVKPTPVIISAPTAKPSAINADYSQSPPTRLVIPKLGLDTAVKEVTVQLGSWQVADYAAGHNLGTANPGEIGNLVLAGHRDIRGSVFLKLPNLQKGDEFMVYSSAGVFRYSVTDIFEVAPTDISVMNPTTEATATLITCTPLGTSARRFVVRAKLVS